MSYAYHFTVAAGLQYSLSGANDVREYNLFYLNDGAEACCTQTNIWEQVNECLLSIGEQTCELTIVCLSECPDTAVDILVADSL